MDAEPTREEIDVESDAEKYSLPDFTFQQLSPELQHRVAELGWIDPMPVQAKAIPFVKAGHDCCVQARTGSGKTGAYLLPIIEAIDRSNPWCQALVLVPTRELARQVYSVLVQLTAGTGIQSALLYGGVGYREQVQALKGVHFAVGTPGRILDHIYRGSFSVQRIAHLVLDEADEMLSMGFYPAMKKIRSQLPGDRRTYLFSATIPYHVERLTREFLVDPVRLSLSAGAESVSSLDHVYYIVPALQKEHILMKLIEFENPESAIIFCNTKRNVEYLVTVLKNNGYDAKHLTGDLAQKKRERTLESLHDGSLRFLVGTDLVARGIDISDLSHVFLYDIPEDVELYVHRSGRTARAGKTGIAITLCEDIEERKLTGISRQYHFELEKRTLPSDEEISQRVAERVLVQLEAQMLTLSLTERDRLNRFLPLVNQLAGNDEARMLLALLLDLAYVQGLHQPLFSPEIGPAAVEDGDRHDRGGGPGKKRRHRDRKDKPNHTDAHDIR